MKHKHFTIAISAVLLFLIWRYWDDSAFPITSGSGRWFWVAMLVSSYLLVTAYGVFQIKANYFVQSINKGNQAGIALTFDDGPDPEFTPKILEILDAHQLPATFFIIGKKAEAQPELVKEIARRGHLIGNHSYSHTPQLTVSLKKNLEADFRRCNDIIKTLTGAEVRFFRPPFGVTNPRYAKVLKKLDLQSVGWSLRSFDTVIKDPQRLLRRITKKLENGSIVLLHDTQAINLQTLPGLIRFCEENGIKILPLNELIQ